ncbi:MAG: ABC transporter substrate-binding protein, partial [candidate division NC10 bacterium]|nr:ABC transporter substrate-binding protein [candidate division NC10 bacterium]
MAQVTRRQFTGMMLAGAAATVAGSKGDKIYLRYYYPVGVAGPLAKVMQEMVDEFNQKHDDVVVEAIYSGDYGPTTQKIITAVAAKRPPDVAITSMEDLNTLLAMNALVPLDEFIKQEGGKKFLDDFFPAFLANSLRGGKIWSWPFQRSLPLFYWNKEQFKEVGLDPNQPPQTWDELRDYARRLTVREGDAIKRYGVTISGGWNDWLFEAFVRQVGGQLMDPEGRQITFNSPQALEALDFWVTLSQKDKVMPPTTTWASTPPDFVTGRTSMLFHSSGILRFVKD